MGLTDAHSRYERVQRAGQQLDDACFDQIETAFREQIWPDEMQKAPSWESSDDITEQTQEWVDTVLDLQDPVFDSFSNIPDLAGLEVQSIIKQELQSDDGWSLATIRDKLEPKFRLAMSDQQLDTIARTETAAALNRTELTAIEALPNAAEIPVKWVGPTDGRQTELCNDLSAATQNGVPYAEFKELARSYANEYPEGKTDRLSEGVLHYQERYTIERA